MRGISLAFTVGLALFNCGLTASARGPGGSGYGYYSGHRGGQSGYRNSGYGALGGRYYGYYAGHGGFGYYSGPGRIGGGFATAPADVSVTGTGQRSADYGYDGMGNGIGYGGGSYGNGYGNGYGIGGPYPAMGGSYGSYSSGSSGSGAFGVSPGPGTPMSGGVTQMFGVYGY